VISNYVAEFPPRESINGGHISNAKPAKPSERVLGERNNESVMKTLPKHN